MKTRYRYRIIIALKDEIIVDRFAHAIAHELSSKFGGCTILNGTGYWAPDGQELKALYAKPMVEPCRVIEVVTTKKYGVLIKAAVFAAAYPMDKVVGGQWIHFEREKIKCSHFQI